jgi:hypothetical protein
VIQLKNGYTVEHNNDFDQFFKNLMEGIVTVSRDELANQDLAREEYNEQFLKQVMDNCIYVTHQIFEMQKENEELSRFMVTGFIFNSIIMTLPYLSDEENDGSEEEDIPDIMDDDEDETIIH